MKYTIEELKGQKKISFVLTAQEWEDANESAYNKTKHKYAVQGFRKGKVPRKVIEKNYGAGVFMDDAFNDIFPKYYGEVLDNNPEIYPVDRPEVSFDDMTDAEVKFSCLVTVKPEVKLGKYKGIKLEKVEYNVSADEIEEEIKKTAAKTSRKVNVTDRAVQSGDTVTLDYSGSVDGVKFNGGTAEKQELEIGSNSFIPGFEDQMIGMTIGEEKDLKVTFPTEYHSADLAGKEAVFAVKVHEIKVKEVPALDDDFAKDVSTFDTFEEYKADVQKKLNDAKTKKAEIENENKLLEAIIADIEMDVPECMINSQTDYFLQDFEYRLMYQGMKMDDYFKYTKTTKEDFKRERREEAIKTVKTRLSLEKIISVEKLEVSEDEIDAKIAEIASRSNKTVAEYKPTISAEQMEYIKNDALMSKTLNFLKENN